MGMSTGNTSTLGMMLAGGGAVMNAMGAYRTAAGQRAALDYQASVANSNAKIADQQAQIAEENGQVEEQASRLKTAALLGDQKAVAAANGVDVNSGSPVELMASAKYLGERDAFTLRDNAARMAWAYRQKALGYRNEASMDTSTADAMSPGEAAFGSLLSSAGTVASRWYAYNKSVNGVGS